MPIEDCLSDEELKETNSSRFSASCFKKITDIPGKHAFERIKSIKYNGSYEEYICKNCGQLIYHCEKCGEREYKIRYFGFILGMKLKGIKEPPSSHIYNIYCRNKKCDALFENSGKEE